jgi:general secretion pathway protein L
VLDGLKVEITAAKRAADSTAKLRAESERLIEEGRFLADRKRQAPSPLRTLEELSRLLPDDTWLVEFSISGGQGRMAGFSAAASKLIPLIEDSNGFRNARFRSPVTPTPTGDSERFDLAFDLQTEARE